MFCNKKSLSILFYIQTSNIADDSLIEILENCSIVFYRSQVNSKP